MFHGRNERRDFPFINTLGIEAEAVRPPPEWLGFNFEDDFEFDWHPQRKTGNSDDQPS